jgi:hypothetical protein
MAERTRDVLQGSGWSIEGMTQVGMPPVADAFMHLYEEQTFLMQQQTERMERSSFDQLQRKQWESAVNRAWFAIQSHRV